MCQDKGDLASRTVNTSNDNKEDSEASHGFLGDSRVRTKVWWCDYSKASVGVVFVDVRFFLLCLRGTLFLLPRGLCRRARPSPDGSVAFSRANMRCVKWVDGQVDD